MFRLFSWYCSLILKNLNNQLSSYNDYKYNHVYVPSLSLFWSLNSQVFFSLRFYFKCLWISQAVFLVIIIGTILSNIIRQNDKSNIPVSTSFTNNVINSNSNSNLVKAAATKNQLIALKMSIYLILFLTTFFSSILTQYLWLNTGILNSNYLFFQIIILWLSCFFSLIDFLKWRMKVC